MAAASAADRAVLVRTIRRYQACDRFTRIYVACKLRMDPVIAAVLALAEAAPLGSVIDAGCGRGQLSMALLEAGGADTVLGLDQDGHALAQLRLAGAGLKLRTRTLDLGADGLDETADTVLLVDVLYQLPSADQITLVRRAAAAARRMVIIRSSDPHAGWRSALSAGLERAARRFWPTFGDRVNPLPTGQLAQALEACGFAVDVMPCAQGTPLAGMLLVGRRVTPRQPAA